MEQHSDSDSESWRWSRPPRTTPPVIDRRVLPSGEVEEWERAATIPDDFIYDPETHSYYAPGEGVTWDIAAEMREFEEARRRGEFRGGLISADELRAARALKAKPSRRKSRSSSAERDLFSDLKDDEDSPAEEQAVPDDHDPE